MEYRHSPKVICITGPRTAGKTFVAKMLASDFGYHHIWLDGINGKVCEQLGIVLDRVNRQDPRIQKAYADLFMQEIKGNRYRNIVFEGERIRIPYILGTFLANVANYYGEYAIVAGFSLVPPEELRYRFFMRREVARVKTFVKDNAGKPREQWSGDGAIREFDANVVPDPPGFAVVESHEDILAWARENADARHPGLPEKYAHVVKAVADSGTYTPFYQTVEIDGSTLIRGMTRSDLSWKNVRSLGIDFRGKRVCDLGSMHGYFSFKAEESGAGEVLGLELNPGSVQAARVIAEARGSRCEFKVADVTRDPLPESDIILALNMLHWIKDLEGFADTMAAAAPEFVMEIGETQIKRIMKALRPKGYDAAKVVKSHRPDKLIGQRYLFHFVDDRSGARFGPGARRPGPAAAVA